MRKTTMGLAGFSLVAAILAFHFWNQLREDRKQIATLRQQVEQLQTERIADAARPAAISMPFPAVSASGAAPAGASVQQAAQGAAGTASPPVLVATPNCEVLLAQLKQSASRYSGEIASELKLSPAEAKRVTEIREAQLGAALPSCGDSNGSGITLEQLQLQLEATLGPARYEQLQEFNAKRSTEANMTTLRSQLIGIGEPLDEEQGRKLTETILEENRRTRLEAGSTVVPTEPHARLAFEERNLRLTEERFERVLAAAQYYLRPEQLALLRNNMKQQTNATRSRLAQMRKSVEAGQGIPPPSPTTLMIAP